MQVWSGSPHPEGSTGQSNVPLQLLIHRLLRPARSRLPFAYAASHYFVAAYDTIPCIVTRGQAVLPGANKGNSCPIKAPLSYKVSLRPGISRLGEEKQCAIQLRYCVLEQRPPIDCPCFLGAASAAGGSISGEPPKRSQPRTDSVYLTGFF